jgi:20S proteasome alpha/beta subunit
MSLAINTTTPEGIVLAADSRQSYRNQKGVSRIGSDSASKLFLINNRIGVAVTGLAFLQENGIPKNISKFIEQFKREIEVEKLSVKEVADKLHFLFDKKLNWREQLDKLPDQIKDNFTKQGLK